MHIKNELNYHELISPLEILIFFKKYYLIYYALYSKSNSNVKKNS